MEGAGEEAESKFLSFCFFFVVVAVVLALSVPLKSSCASWTSYQY